MKNYLIKRVWVYDGTGTSPFLSDVYLKEGKINKIEREINIEADEEVDGEGMALSPGFINVHSHSDLVSLADKKCSMLSDRALPLS